MHLQFEHIIPLPAALVFAFHEDPKHLELLHRGWSRFRLIDHDGCVQPGSCTCFEITLACLLPVRLEFEHFLYEPPYRFGERLVHGPFRRFVHVHQFEPCSAGTVVRDLLDVRLPGHYGGEAAMRGWVAPMLRRAFRMRGRALEHLVLSGQLKQCTPNEISYPRHR